MKRVLFVVAILAGVLGAAKPAAADIIAFDYTGATGPNTFGFDRELISQFDWWAGNAILLEDESTILYQANLNVGSPEDACSNSGVLDPFRDCLTAVATLFVTPTATPGEFSVTGGTFDIWAHATYCDDLVGGDCFDSGTRILASTVIAPFGTTSFTAATAPLEDLDQAGDTNDWPGVLTVVGTGGFANILTSVTFADPTYFLDLMAGATVSTTISGGSNNLPFHNVDPTALFFDGTPGVPLVGPVNGFGSAIMTESDAATTVQLAQPPGVIPEPATLTLLGIGLAGSAALRRRQARKAKKQ